MKIRHLKASDYPLQTWKNGQGTTLELAVDEKTPYRWRLSSATMIGASEFSLYEGYQRALILLGPGPLHLRHEGAGHRSLASFEVYSFSGDLKTKAELIGAAQDFNVWAKHGEARASVFAMNLKDQERVDFPLKGDEHFIYCVEGSLSLFERNTDHTYQVNPGEMLHLKRLPRKECLDLQAKGEGAARFIWTVIHLAEKTARQKKTTTGKSKGL